MAAASTIHITPLTGRACFITSPHVSHACAVTCEPSSRYPRCVCLVTKQVGTRAFSPQLRTTGHTFVSVYRPLRGMTMLFKLDWPIWPPRCHQSNWLKWILLQASLAPSWGWQMSTLKRTQLRGPGGSSTLTPLKGSIPSVTVHAHLPVVLFVTRYCHAHVTAWLLLNMTVRHGHMMMHAGCMMMHVGRRMLVK